MGTEYLLAAAEHGPRHLISPNIHIILVHFPLGIFVFGLFLEVFSFLWRRSTVRVAARWMILFGGLFAVPAALTGLDAYKDVMDYNRPTLTEGSEGLTLLQRHLLFTSIGAAIAALTVTFALALSDRSRRRVYIYFPLLLLLIAAAVLMTFGAHFGGEGIFLQGVAVKLKGEPATGFEFYAPARSTHVLVAGLAFAVSLGALGASFRAVGHVRKLEQDERAQRELENLVPAAPPMPRRVTDDLTVARTLNAEADLPPPRVPAARFWLLATLLFAATVGFGVWFLISQEETSFDLAHASVSSIVHEVLMTARATPQMSQNRRGAHIVLGCALIVVPLLLAAAVWLAPRRRFVLGTLCLLCLLIMAAELWLGVLLIREGSEGPLLRFAPEPTTAAAMCPFA